MNRRRGRAHVLSIRGKMSTRGRRAAQVRSIPVAAIGLSGFNFDCRPLLALADSPSIDPKADPFPPLLWRDRLRAWQTDLDMIERIFIRPAPGAPPLERGHIEVVAGAGVRGDRYFDAHDEPGQNITFLEAEEIEAFAQQSGRSCDAAATGRNIVTRGVRLNGLVGKTFEVGGLRFKGIELCEPCLNFGKALATEALRPADVIKAWVHRAGLRADALSTGTLAVGAHFQAIE